MKIDKAVGSNRVGQSREILEILFEFGSTFATALAVSEAFPTTELAACGGRDNDPKHQIVYLAHVTRCQRCSKMWPAERNQWRVDYAKFLYIATHNQSLSKLMIAYIWNRW